MFDEGGGVEGEEGRVCEGTVGVFEEGVEEGGGFFVMGLDGMGWDGLGWGKRRLIEARGLDPLSQKKMTENARL